MTSVKGIRPDGIRSVAFIRAIHGGLCPKIGSISKLRAKAVCGHIFKSRHEMLNSLQSISIMEHGTSDDRKTYFGKCIDPIPELPAEGMNTGYDLVEVSTNGSDCVCILI